MKHLVCANGLNVLGRKDDATKLYDLMPADPNTLQQLKRSAEYFRDKPVM